MSAQTYEGLTPLLRVELVPTTCWHSNVRSFLSEHHWRALSRTIAHDAGGVCEICRGRGRRHGVECHEVWFYDAEQQVQLLARLQALCPMCHAVKHLGRAIALGKEEMAVHWLGRVNGWDTVRTQRYVDAVFRQWTERSRQNWTLGQSVLGEAYDIPLHRLSSYVLDSRAGQQMQHGRVPSLEDVYQRDGTRAR